MSNHLGNDDKQENFITEILPVVITKITVQKKNSNRFSLFHNEQFLVGISSKTLTDFSLHEGVELTPSLFNKIKQSEEIHAVRESCLRYLGRRDHASFELRDKISKKGFDKKIINIVIEEFQKKGYINDEQFAQIFASEKAELNKWGPQKIKSALFKKGIDKRSIDKAIKNLRENLQQDQICVDLVLKRKAHFLREEDPYKRKQKIFRYLAGRGFTSSVIKQSMPQIAELLDA